jgi:hypothetical protein
VGFVKIMSCNNSYLKNEDAISTFQVIEIGVINGNMKEVSYFVY